MNVTEGVVELIDYLRGEVSFISAGQTGTVVSPIGEPAPDLAPEIAVYDLESNGFTSGQSKVNWGAVHAADFKVTKLSKIRLAPENSTSTFKVTFKPRANGARSAAIRIKSNDKDENPFDIRLAGTGKK